MLEISPTAFLTDPDSHHYCDPKNKEPINGGVCDSSKNDCSRWKTIEPVSLLRSQTYAFQGMEGVSECQSTPENGQSSAVPPKF